MPMYNLMEYNDNYSRDEPVAIMINPESFKSKPCWWLCKRC